MFDRQSFAKRLKILRGNLSQEAFGESLDVSQTYINHLEKGRRAPTLDFLLKLSAETTKSIDSLMKGGDFKPGKQEKLNKTMNQFIKKLRVFEKDLDEARREDPSQDSEVA